MLRRAIMPGVEPPEGPDEQDAVLTDIRDRLAKQDEDFRTARDKLYRKLDGHE